MKIAFHPTLLLITGFFLLTNNLGAQEIVADLAGGNRQLAVYPNSVSDQLTITNKALTGKETAALKIFDLFGGEIYKSSIINKPSITINVSGFANGIYFVQLETGNQLLRAKFVKQ